MSIMSAAYLQALPTVWAPVFDICHFILAALAIRKEVGLPFSRSNPLATWLATMTASFAGSMIANPLLGKPILGALSNEYNVILATLVWWAVFYSPGDMVYSIVNIQALYIPICIIKEIYRGKKILGGINDANKVFPDQELLMVMIGLIKGNGSGFMKPFTRLVCGTWQPGKTELLSMSTTSKECLVAALLMVADKAGYIPSTLSGDLLYLVIILTFLMVKLSGLLAEPVDPFTTLETSVATLAFGGLWDGESGDEEKEEKVEKTE